jgi:hypothetical protein
MAYFRTTYVFEVLSEEPMPDPIGLEELRYQTYEGHCSGLFVDTKKEELTEVEMTAACHEHGTDPGFFMIGVCEECDEEDCPGLIVCPQCNIEEHGIAAATHVEDHGYCRECLRKWQEGDENA